MIFSGILTAVGVVVVAAKFSRRFLKRLLGFEALVDGVVTVGLAMIFATTGTYSGIMTGVVTGLCISGVLWVTGKIIGKEVLTKDGWKEVDPEWTVASLSKFWHSGKLQSFVASRKQEWESGKQAA